MSSNNTFVITTATTGPAKINAPPPHIRDAIPFDVSDKMCCARSVSDLVARQPTSMTSGERILSHVERIPFGKNAIVNPTPHSSPAIRRSLRHRTTTALGGGGCKPQPPSRVCEFQDEAWEYDLTTEEVNKSIIGYNRTADFMSKPRRFVVDIAKPFFVRTETDAAVHDSKANKEGPSAAPASYLIHGTAPSALLPVAPKGENSSSEGRSVGRVAFAAPAPDTVSMLGWSTQPRPMTVFRFVAMQTKAKSTPPQRSFS